jgi:hypothetical protein
MIVASFELTGRNDQNENHLAISFHPTETKGILNCGAKGVILTGK